MRHDVVHFIYMHYLLVLDRHKKCPVPMKEVGRKGSANYAVFQRLGLSSAERTEMYRTEAITSGSGYRGMYGETTNLCELYRARYNSHYSGSWIMPSAYGWIRLRGVLGREKWF